MYKFAAVTFMVIGFGALASADEFDATVTKVDGTNVTFIKKAPKAPKGQKAPKGKPMTLATADGVTVSTGKYAKKTKTYTTVAALENGLQNTVFSQKKVKVHITTNADNKITQILVLSKAAKKKKTQ